MGYNYVWEQSGGGQHIDVDWSPNFEDLYSLELDFRIFVWPMYFLLVSYDFWMRPHHSLYTLDH